MGAWVDLGTWKRRQHYQLFRRYKQPYFSVTVEVDVTRTWNACRRPGSPPFFLTSLFLMLRAVNGVDAFRLRLRARGVWRHDHVAVGATIPGPDGTFRFVRLEPSNTLNQFVARGRTAIAEAAAREYLEPQEASDDIVFHSVLPWMRFTSFTNALPGGMHSIPRIVFGKCTGAKRRMKLPVAIEVHHAVVDGADVALFLDRFSELCALPRQPK